MSVLYLNFSSSSKNKDSCQDMLYVHNAYFVSVAVVVAFFICWAPFHAQRLVAIYLATAPKEAQESSTTVYITLMHASGILYFLSTTINPVLYHIFSNKFRRAFKVRYRILKALSIIFISGYRNTTFFPKTVGCRMFLKWSPYTFLNCYYTVFN